MEYVTKITTMLGILAERSQIAELTPQEVQLEIDYELALRFFQYSGRVLLKAFLA